MPPETRAQKKRQAHSDPQGEEQPAKRQRSSRHSKGQPSNKPSSKDEEQAPAQQAPNATVAKGRRSARPQGARSGRRGAAHSQAQPAEQPVGPGNPPPIPAAPAPQQAPEIAASKPADKEDHPMAGRGRDEDGEGDDMARNLSSASNALQGLLRKLGAGFDDAFMAMGGVSGGRFKNIIADLRQAEDEGAQLTALTELCELLAISSEENLTTFPVETAVPLLVQSLNTEHNPDIMLVAARALTFLADMMPSACSSIVRHGAVTSFCQRLLTIEYIDLAEQSLLVGVATVVAEACRDMLGLKFWMCCLLSPGQVPVMHHARQHHALQALEKLSHEHAHALLQQGGLLAVLSYLDFFPTGVQRIAVGTAANMCRGLTTDDAGAVQEAIPMLTNLLQYQDAKVVDSACQALSNIAESYANKPNLLGMLSSGGLITQALQMITLTENGSCSAQLSLTTYYSMIKLLTTCCSKSSSVAQQLLEGQLLPILYTLLATSSLLPTHASRSNSHAMLRSADQLHEVLSLLCELLPPIGTPSNVVMEDLPAVLDNDSGQSATSSSSVPKQDERSQYYQAFPDATRQAVQQLVPLVLQLHSATVMPHVRQQCCTTLLRLLALASPSVLQDALRSTAIFSFLSSLLASRDQPTQAAGLLMCEILMTKLPQTYKQSFLKEGVLQALHHMAKPAGSAAAKPQAPAAPAAAADVQAGQVAAADGKADKSEERRRVTRASSKKNSPSNSSKELAAAATPAGTAARSTSPSSKPPAPSSGPSLPRPACGSTPATQVDAGERADEGSKQAAATPAAVPTLGSKLATRAAAFCDKYFADCVPGSHAMDTDGMKQLRAAAEQLCKDKQAVQQLLQLLSSGASPAPSSSDDNVDAQTGAADMVLDTAPEAGGGITVYELLNSGAVQALTEYLQGADLNGQGSQAELLARLRSFVSIALAGDSGDQPLLVPVMRKLQAALAAAETFPVLLSRVQPTRVPGSGSGLARLGGGLGSGSAALSSSAGSYRSGLAALSRPFKLRLCRHSSEKGLRDYGSNVVLIEPLASMSTIEDFLYPRVCQTSSTAAPSRDGSLPAPAAAATGTVAGTSSGAAAGAKASQAASKDADRAGSLGALLNGARQAAAAATAAAAAAAAAQTTSKPPSARPSSSAQPIPDEKGTRRTTRASARARANASAAAVEAAAPAGVVEDEDGDVLMGPAPEEGDVDEDQEMEEAYAEEGAAMEGMPPGAAFYDDDDDEEDYDEELEGDDDDGDMDIGPMPVHDLHVEDQPAPSPTDAGLPRTWSSPAPRPSGSAAAAAQPSRLVPTTSEPAPAWGAARSSAAAAAAAAATAAAPSGSAWDRRDGAGSASAAVSEQPRLVFYSGSQKLASTTTVFQAIQQLSIAQMAGSNQEGGAMPSIGSGAGSERQVWDGIYTLYYRAADATDAQPSAAAAAADAASAGGPMIVELKSTGSSAGLPLGSAAHLHLIQAVSLPEDLTAEPACLQVLKLIKVLEVVNRLGARLCYAAEAEDDALGGSTAASTAGLPQQPRSACSGQPAEASDRPVYGRSPRGELVCSKLNSKLAQQLKDVLAICGGGMPAWCKQLVFSCKHLFTFDIRRHYFYCTALGLGRALQHMQALHANEGGGVTAGSGGPAERDTRDMRLGRLQRQKVRVSRKRILESAIKVMELYASQRAVLELEYFGEVGTGLGPTLEFYTLLSHDLQRRSLKMWRHEDAATPGTPPDGEAQQEEGTRASLNEQPASSNVDVNGLGPIASAARQALTQGNRPALSAQTHVEAWHDDTQFVNAPWGLFPCPLPPSLRSAGKVLDLFKLLGRAMAKALQDNRLMDLPLSYTFYRAAQGVPLDMYDIASFDPVLGQQLQRLWSSLLATQGRPNQAAPAPQPAPKQGGGRKRGGGSSKRAAAPSNNAAGTAGKPVMVDGVPVEDLCLTFTLPGYPEYELVPGGADIVVDSHNLNSWIQAVVNATLGDGIASQLTAFRTGFNEVFPLSHLAAFYEDEIESLLCGTGERWDVASLSAAIKFDHGYTPGSPVVIALLEVLAELDSQDQRRFLRFVTGCPRLPSGGLSALQPRLTVVRKHPSSERSASLGSTPMGSLRITGDVLGGGGTVLADGDLPSVMTCANYIKLPPYSSKQVLRERLLYAIREGQGSFDLS